MIISDTTLATMRATIEERTKQRDELAVALQTARKELVFHMRHIDSEMLLQDAEIVLEVIDAALVKAGL